MRTITFTNTSDKTVKLGAIGLSDVAPGGDVEVPLELAAPGRSDSGGRSKSAIESVAPQLVPKDAGDRAVWEDVPAPVPQESRIVTSVGRHPASEAPGVAALRVAKERKTK